MSEYYLGYKINRNIVSIHYLRQILKQGKNHNARGITILALLVNWYSGNHIKTLAP